MSEILAVSGSPRKKGNSDFLAWYMLEGAREEGLNVQTVYLRDYCFSSCTGCEKCRTDKHCTRLLDGMQLIYPLLFQAKGLILVSPVHFYNISALTKAFIDRLYQFFDFSNTRPRNYSSRLADQGRLALISAVCEQEGKENMGFAMQAMHWPLQSLGYDIIGELPVYGYFDAGAVQKAPGIRKEANKMGQKLARCLK